MRLARAKLHQIYRHALTTLSINGEILRNAPLQRSVILVVLNTPRKQWSQDMVEQVYAQTMVADFNAKPGGHLYEPLFNILLGYGLEPYGSSNSHTLLFKFAEPSGKKHNLLAFRRHPIRVLSFPKSFWLNRKTKRVELCALFDPISEMPTVGPGGGPSVKESVGQVAVREETLERLKGLCEHVCELAQSQSL